MMTDHRRADSHSGNASTPSQHKARVSAGVGWNYEILVEGHLDGHWAEWLGGLEIRYDGEGNTLLSGIIPDQPALHGILVQIRDLGLPLVSLRRVDL